MNNRVQQRFDRSIREARAAIQRRKDLDWAESQAYAEERRRNAPLAPAKPTRATKRVSEADKLRAYDAEQNVGTRPEEPTISAKGDSNVLL